LFPQEFHPDDKGTTTKIEGILGFVASTDHFWPILGIPVEIRGSWDVEFVFTHGMFVIET